MNEKPILFNGEMVRAILDGRKTQTRRPVRTQPEYGAMPCHWSPTGWARTAAPNEHGAQGCTCSPISFPFVEPPDGLLWVKEAYKLPPVFDKSPPSKCGPYPESNILYLADGRKRFSSGVMDGNGRYRHARFMPRWASRLTLRVTAVRVERVQDITREDALAEGIDLKSTWNCYWTGSNFKDNFANLWDNINAKRGYTWESNPLVWVVEFEKVTL